mgnify:FL=1
MCSYLIEHCGLTVDQALQSFASSRPPGVKHEKFRQELRARYGSGGSSTSSSSATAAPMSVPAAAQLVGEASHSSSVSIPHLQQQVAGLAASPAGAGCGSSRALSCRSCASSCSTAAVGWLAGGSPDVTSGSGRLQGSSPGSSPQPLPTEFAGSPPVSPLAAARDAAAVEPDCLRCSWCNTELSPEDAAAALAPSGASHQATAAGDVTLTPQRGLPPSCNGGSVLDNTSCFAAASNNTAYQTPPPYPLLPGLARSSSRGALLSSSPSMLRASNRCWSSNSIGDNSSIGCSPTSSTADLINLRTSGLVSTRSSGLDSSTGGGGPDTPGDMRADVAAEGAGSYEGPPGMLSQQWLGCADNPVGASRGSRQRQRGGGGSGDYAGGRFWYGRGSGGGCSSSGAAEGPCEDEDTAEGSGLEEGCFEMDPYMDPRPPAGQQQQQQGGFSSRAESGGMRRKSVTFQDAAVACCEQPAPGCSTAAAGVQQLRGADLDSLLAAVSIRHQQQVGQASLPQLSPPAAAPPLVQLQEVQLVTAAADGGPCSCDCHSEPLPALPPVNGVQGPGYSIQDGEVRSADRGGSRQLYAEPAGSDLCLPLPRRQYSSEDGVCDPLENESFGRVTSADLLKNLR